MVGGIALRLPPRPLPPLAASRWRLPHLRGTDAIARPPPTPLSGPVWSEVAAVSAAGGPSARSAAAVLEHTVLHARAPSTLAGYARWVRQLRAFTLHISPGASAWPASPAHVALWVADLAGRSLAPSTLEGAVAAIAWAHHAAGEPDPTTDPVVRLALDGATRLNARPANQKPALSAIQVCTLMSHLSAKPELRHWRTAAMLAISFGGFLRLDELVRLRLSDVTAEPGRLCILVRRSKTDQLAHGHRKYVAVAPAGAPVCPVRTFARYRARLLRSAPISPPTSLPLWPRIMGGVDGEAMWSKSVSKDVARRALAEVLDVCGLGDVGYTWHSCKSGAATAAFRAGVAPLTIQALGGWTSDAYRVYVRHDDDELRDAASAVWSAAAPDRSPLPVATSTLPRSVRVPRQSTLTSSASQNASSVALPAAPVALPAAPALPLGTQSPLISSGVSTPDLPPRRTRAANQVATSRPHRFRDD